MFYSKKIKTHSSCEIEDFVETHICKLCVILGVLCIATYAASHKQTYILQEDTYPVTGAIEVSDTAASKKEFRQKTRLNSWSVFLTVYQKQ